MKLNQATTTAVAFLSIATTTFASSESHGELKDKIAPLLVSRPNRYLLRNRMLQLSDACIADYFNTPRPNFFDAIEACSSMTQEGDTTFVNDYSPCDVSVLQEACSADNGILVEDKFGDLSYDCNFWNGEFMGIIEKSSPWCVATSCVSEWESADGQLPEGLKKTFESIMTSNVANENAYAFDDVQCKISSSAGKATGMLALVLCVTLALAVVGLGVLGVKKLRQKNGNNATVGGSGEGVVTPHAAAAPTVMAAEDQVPTVDALPEENVITAVPPPQAYAYVATSAPPPTVNVTAEPYDSKYGY